MAPSPPPDARSAYDEARASWGFPAFAHDLPRHPEIDALVVAFAAGDYRAVRAGAAKVAGSSTDPEVKKAAETLSEHVKPDPTARVLFLVAAGLLVLLTGWWTTHDGPPTELAPKKTETAK